MVEKAGSVSQVSATIHGQKSIRFTLAAVCAAARNVLRRIDDGTAWDDGHDPNDLIVYEAVINALNDALPESDRITLGMLEWTPESSSPAPTELLAMVTRSDDNGHVVIVGDELSPDAARAMHDMLAARGHKQAYNIETYPPGGSQAVQQRLGAVR